MVDVKNQKLSIKNIVMGKTNSEKVKALQKEFKEKSFVLLPGFMDRFLVEKLNSLILKTEGTYFYEPEKDATSSKGLLFTDNRELIFYCNELLNQPNLISFFKEITGKENVESHIGYIYRTIPTDRNLCWHKDMTDGRQFVLSINLSLVPYDGGEFVLRQADTQAELLRIKNIGVGDAIIANIDENLEHCTTKVQNDTVRLTMAGWGIDYKMYNVDPLYKSNPA